MSSQTTLYNFTLPYTRNRLCLIASSSASASRCISLIDMPCTAGRLDAGETLPLPLHDDVNAVSSTNTS
jgi:hypothetical protein